MCNNDSVCPKIDDNDPDSFKKLLEEKYGVAGHPKANLLYMMADEEGHHAGIEEVERCYDHLVQLILPEEEE